MVLSLIYKDISTSCDMLYNYIKKKQQQKNDILMGKHMICIFLSFSFACVIPDQLFLVLMT